MKISKQTKMSLTLNFLPRLSFTPFFLFPLSPSHQASQKDEEWDYGHFKTVFLCFSSCFSLLQSGSSPEVVVHHILCGPPSLPGESLLWHLQHLLLSFFTNCDVHRDVFPYTRNILLFLKYTFSEVPPPWQLGPALL